MTAPANRFERFVTHAAESVVRHWLLLMNIFIVAYASLPWLSPLLKQAGWQRSGDIIFRFYSMLCHQLPDRSFYVGQYQVCYCHRCTALYTSCAVFALLYGVLRWKLALPPHLLLVAAVPMLIDGLWHLANDLLPGWGIRSSFDGVGSPNFWLRMVTGGLLGVAAILWALPRFDNELLKATKG